MVAQDDAIQKRFFSLIKDRVPAHISLVDQVCELLNISYDSAYRRIRGDKPLTLQELQLLSTHYNVSVDALINLDTDSVIFQTNSSGREHGLDSYLTGIYNDLEKVKAAKEKKITYCTKDIPVLHYFNFPELAWFKIFFWGKTIFKHSGTEKQRFSFDELDMELFNKGARALAMYNQIPSAEIWNTESANSTLRQIEFYQESGFFANPTDTKLLYEQLAALIEHMKSQAEAGQKFTYGAQPAAPQKNFEFYINEVILGYTTILIEADNYRTTFFLHDVLDFLITSDQKFCQKTADILHNIIGKSSLISTVNEKERNKYFLQLLNKVRQPNG